MNKIIKIEIALGVIIIIAVIVGGAIWTKSYILEKYLVGPGTPPRACTEEAMQCPDGTYVGRTGLNCEFAACPDAKNDETAGWQTYRNEEYGFEFQYPQGWIIREGDGGFVVLKNLANPIKQGDIDGDIFISFINKAEFPWGLREYDRDLTPIDVYINTFGSQFQDRKFEKTKLNVNGLDVARIKVVSPANPDWIDDEVIIDKGDKFVQISNGAQYSPMFDQIISTFKFTN